jgi:hypothetical protein
MAKKRFDPTLKTLIETAPDSWPPFLGFPGAPVTIIDADIATVSGAADKALQVAATPPYLLHLEFVSGHFSAALPRKVHVRNALLEDRHDLPVHSAVILLRPEANSAQWTGLYQRSYADAPPYLRFHYQVVRVWQLAPGPLLSGDVGLLPLAPISAVTKKQLPGIIEKIGARLKEPGAAKAAETVWAATYLLLGLRHDEAFVQHLLQGVQAMEESTTYRGLIARGEKKGKLAEAKRILQLQGKEAIGPPDAATVSALKQLNDLATLEDMLKRVHSAPSWQALLGKAAKASGAAK